jgi:hypothetical protein
MSYATSVTSASVPILFRLPRELRDLVYDFTLKSESPTIDVASDASPNAQLYRSSSLPLHANQLQFVCRQLCAETSSIASGWRELTFGSTSSKPAIEIFYGFLQRCSFLQADAIRRIVILQPKDESPSRTGTPYRSWFRVVYGASHARLYDFCRAYIFSHVVVRYDFLNPLELQDNQYMPIWLFEHACLRMTLRGAYHISFSDVEIYHGDLCRMTSERGLANMYLNNPLSERHMLTMEDGSWEILKNLRMTVSRTFDEKVLRNVSAEYYLGRGIDIDKRIEEMRNLFEEGC